MIVCSAVEGTDLAARKVNSFCKFSAAVRSGDFPPKLQVGEASVSEGLGSSGAPRPGTAEQQRWPAHLSGTYILACGTSRCLLRARLAARQPGRVARSLGVGRMLNAIREACRRNLYFKRQERQAICTTHSYWMVLMVPSTHYAVQSQPQTSSALTTHMRGCWHFARHVTVTKGCLCPS